MTARAAVLMATWNGEQFLRAQIDSILGQTLRDLVLIVRDDGSTDSTLDILDAYARTDQRVVVHRGTNLGATGSFLELTRLARGAAQVFFFSDQDDVWAADKLDRMTARVLAMDPLRPGLYFTAVRLVDSDLKPLGRELPFFGPPSFGHAMVQGVAQGNVMAMNGALLDLVASRPPQPRLLVMHDMWTMMIAAAFGNVQGDPLPTVEYRQHGRNVFGGQTGFDLLKTRTRRLLAGKMRGRLAAQAREFQRLFGPDLAPRERAALHAFLKAATGPLPVRAAAILSRRYGRMSRGDDLMLRALLLSGLHRLPRTA